MQFSRLYYQHLVQAISSMVITHPDFKKIKKTFNTYQENHENQENFLDFPEMPDFLDLLNLDFLDFLEIMGVMTISLYCNLIGIAIVSFITRRYMSNTVLRKSKLIPRKRQIFLASYKRGFF